MIISLPVHLEYFVCVNIFSSITRGPTRQKSKGKKGKPWLDVKGHFCLNDQRTRGRVDFFQFRDTCRYIYIYPHQRESKSRSVLASTKWIDCSKYEDKVSNRSLENSIRSINISTKVSTSRIFVRHESNLYNYIVVDYFDSKNLPRIFARMYKFIVTREGEFSRTRANCGGSYGVKYFWESCTAARRRWIENWKLGSQPNPAVNATKLESDSKPS